MGVGSDPDAVIIVAEKELGDGASECLEQGQFDVSNKKAGITSPWLQL